MSLVESTVVILL